MNTSTPSQPPERHDRLIREQVHDTYKLRGKLKQPTRCPQCGAVYQKGRWSWTAKIAAGADADETLCSACHRSNDDYPAGEVTLSGEFLKRHEDEILKLAHNIESRAKSEHPMCRIIDIRHLDDRIQITTTDVHLPRRIGKAIQGAWDGELDIHFDEAGYFTRIAWHRDA